MNIEEVGAAWGRGYSVLTLKLSIVTTIPKRARVFRSRISVGNSSTPTTKKLSTPLQSIEYIAINIMKLWEYLLMLVLAHGLRWKIVIMKSLHEFEVYIQFQDTR
jgi:hypothetical protein